MSVGQSRSARDVLLGDGRGSAEAEETGALLPALTSDKPQRRQESGDHARLGSEVA